MKFIIWFFFLFFFNYNNFFFFLLLIYDLLLADVKRISFIFLCLWFYLFNKGTIYISAFILPLILVKRFIQSSYLWRFLCLIHWSIIISEPIITYLFLSILFYYDFCLLLLFLLLLLLEIFNSNLRN